ncbi:MAG: sterol desaturase family protein [Pseudomonadota bacterium]
MLGLLTIVAAMFAAFALLDAFAPARVLPRVRGWRLKGLLMTAGYFAIALTAPFLWDGWLAERQLFNVEALGFWPGVAIGFLAIEVGMWAWHRTLHGVPFLWRHFHQTHHSAERIDVFGAFFFHPLDMLGWTLLGSLALVGFVGVAPEAALVVTLATTFLAMFTHANLKTPRWLGYIIARPESHAAHHERGVHGRNYCDFPLIDMLMGTFCNPREFPEEAGIVPGGSDRWWSLLIGRDLERLSGRKGPRLAPAE